MQGYRDPDLTAQVEGFIADLPMYPEKPTGALVDAVDYVAENGPSARRPVLGEVSLEPDYPAEAEVFGHHLREIRPLGTDIRILCVFGPDRTLVLLYAGDKAGEWKHWYRTAIPEAAKLYGDYLRETGQAET